MQASLGREEHTIASRASKHAVVRNVDSFVTAANVTVMISR